LKKTYLWLYDDTAKALDETNDPEITQFYILDKHKEELVVQNKTTRIVGLLY